MRVLQQVHSTGYALYYYCTTGSTLLPETVAYSTGSTLWYVPEQYTYCMNVIRHRPSPFAFLQPSNENPNADLACYRIFFFCEHKNYLI